MIKLNLRKFVRPYLHKYEMHNGMTVWSAIWCKYDFYDGDKREPVSIKDKEKHLKSYDTV